MSLNLAIIACHFNPAKFRQNQRNFLRFSRQMEAEGVPLFVSELAYNDDPWVLPQAPNVLRLRTTSNHIMWHKENLLNLTEKIVPKKYNALAWIDVDVWFQKLEWYDEASASLERHAVVQMFENVIWTNEDGSPGLCLKSVGSLGKLSLQGTPGFAWAARRNLWQHGGLHERAIIGGGDAVNASAWLAHSDANYNWLRYPSIAERVGKQREWFCEQGGTCGHVEGTLWHEWHGDMQSRNYVNRHKLASQIDYERDLARRPDGLLQFTDSVSSDLRNELQRYFAARNEDGKPSK